MPTAISITILTLSLFFTALAPAAARADTADFDIERIFSAPSLTTTAPQRIQISPSGEWVSYLAGSADAPNVYDLWLYQVRENKHQRLVQAADLTASDITLSAEEQARRERMRISASGIVDYQWSPDSQSLLFPLQGQLYLYDITSGHTQQLTNADYFATDVRFSPLGNYISFVHDYNLWLIDLAQQRTLQLTERSSATEQFATAEFVAQEEMKRMTGYWWSPDERHIALTRVDLSQVPIQTRVDIHANQSTLVQQPYPAAGQTNALVDLGVLSLPAELVPESAEQLSQQLSQPLSQQLKPQWFNLPKRHGSGYLARVNWVPDSKRLSYQWQNRLQQQLNLYVQDINTTGAPQLVLQETSAQWVNLHDDLHFMEDARHLVWASERSGFKHLYLYRLDGSLIRQLTSGDWNVDEVSHVDEITGVVYFTGRKQTPLERHLYRASLNTNTPSQPSQLSQRRGMHQVVFAGNGRSYISYFSSAKQPPQVSLHGPTGERIVWLHENKINAEHPLAPYIEQWSYPEFGELTAADGQTLYYRVHKPPMMADNRRYPAVVMVYGGPRAQRVTNSWGDYFTQYLARQGFVVFALDNRGSGNRGRQFETGIYRQLAQLEVADQQLGAQWLAQQSYVDGERIGVFGHSYGGYMALHLILRAQQQFAAAVAGAPVTDWALYDTHYTERYMGTPQDNPDGYRAANVMTYAKQLQRPLLIYHGMADDNVLYSHTALLTWQLQQQMLPFEMMAYPGKAHGLSGRETSIHRYQMIADFFARHLQ